MSEHPVFLIHEQHFVPGLSPIRRAEYPALPCCGPYAWPSAHASTTLGLRGSISTRPIRPVFSNPINVQVLPASVDL